MAIVVLLVAAIAAGQSSKRVVRLEVMVDSDPAPVQITLREDQTLITEIKDLGTFGFEPRFQKGKEATVLIVIFDAETSPPILLGAVDVPVNGKRVESATSPRFGLRIARMETAREDF